MRTIFLNKIVEIYKRDNSSTAWGEKSGNFTMTFKVWARVKDISAKESEEENDVLILNIKELILRKSVSTELIKIDDRVKIENKIFQIIQITDIESGFKYGEYFTNDEAIRLLIQLKEQ